MIFSYPSTAEKSQLSADLKAANSNRDTLCQKYLPSKPRDVGKGSEQLLGVLNRFHGRDLTHHQMCQGSGHIGNLNRVRADSTLVTPDIRLRIGVFDNYRKTTHKKQNSDTQDHRPSENLLQKPFEVALDLLLSQSTSLPYQKPTAIYPKEEKIAFAY